MMRVAIIGAGSVGRAVGTGMVTAGHTVVFGVRNPGDQRYADLSSVGTIGAAVDGADVLVLAVPADAVPVTVPTLGPRAGQVVIDATNAVRSAVPDGFATMGDLVASLVPSGVQVAKAFTCRMVPHRRARCSSRSPATPTQPPQRWHWRRAWASTPWCSVGATGSRCSNSMPGCGSTWRSAAAGAVGLRSPPYGPERTHTSHDPALYLNGLAVVSIEAMDRRTRRQP